MATAAQTSEASLNIRNNATQAVTVHVDGRPVIEIQPGSSHLLSGLTASSHQLTAYAGDTIVAQVRAELPAKGTYVWNLGQTDAVGAGAPLLRVRNYLGEPATLVVQGHPRIQVDPGESAVLTGVPLGRAALEARAADGRVLLQTTVDIVGGMERLWVMERPGGGVAVVEIRNATSGPIRVGIDGGVTRELEPAASTRYDAVSPGNRTFQAWVEGRLLDSLSADVQPNTPYEWVVEASSAGPYARRPQHEP